MGDAVSLEPKRTAEWTRPTSDKSLSTGNTVTQVQNPDIKISMSTNAITPPGMIVANAVTPVDVVKPVKPELEVEISKYFQESFLGLEYEFIRINAQNYYSFTIDDIKNTGAIPPLKVQLESNDLVSEYPSLVKSVVQNDAEFKKLIEFAMQNKVNNPRYDYEKLVPGPDGKVALPEWLAKGLETVAKKYVYFYASHKHLNDFGMDMDYLSMPIIKYVKYNTKQMYAGFNHYNITFFLSDYEKFLNKYDGVGTIGSLGKALSSNGDKYELINGVELYGIWSQLKSAGLVENYKWEDTQENGKKVINETAKWLQIPSDMNVRNFVAGLKTSPKYEAKLILYLKKLQKGKQKSGFLTESAFAADFAVLRSAYCTEVLVKDYLVGGFKADAVGYGIDGYKQDNYRNYYRPKVDEWMKEYYSFEADILKNTAHLFFDDEKSVSNSKKEFFETLENKKQLFDGKRLPLGQEFLFLILDKADEASSFLDDALYDIKFK
ncbi:MAG: hypothetical protein PHF25_04920 [Candidatus Margulisbacteria bacterium]|nr:hypothetical protein [Candidatus Margulisiibacteriota bacterium]